MISEEQYFILTHADRRLKCISTHTNATAQVRGHFLIHFKLFAARLSDRRRLSAFFDIPNLDIETGAVSTE